MEKSREVILAVGDAPVTFAIPRVPVGRLPYMDYTGPAERIFKWGQLGGSGGMPPRENLKLKSFEMARNGSKTAKSEVNF